MQSQTGEIDLSCPNALTTHAALGERWQAREKPSQPTYTDKEHTMSVEEFCEVIIKRDSGRDLKFQGQQIAFGTNREHQGDLQNRYNEVTIYKTKAGKYVLHQEYVTHWQGENNTSCASVHDTMKDAMDRFKYGETDLDELDYAQYGLSRWQKEFVEACGFPEYEEIE